MSLLEDLKRGAERLTGIGRPAKADLEHLLRARKPMLYRFHDDGATPNNPKLPMVIYRTPVRLDSAFDPAAIFEALFAANGWKESWRDGIYDYLHYHSKTHEVLGIARGSATVRFGGKAGRKLTVKSGDVIVMPAGTGHQRLSQHKDLLVVGAYPPRAVYDECRSTAENHAGAVKRIMRAPAPKRDPVYGADGPIARLWRR